MADFVDNPSHNRTAEFIGHITRSVLARLPEASVEWRHSKLLATVVTVSVTEGELRHCVSRSFGEAVDLKGTVADWAKRFAASIAEEMVDGIARRKRGDRG